MDTSRNAVALRYLRYLAVREGGYVRRGVPGWALREDVEHGTRLKLPERLPRLHAQGLLDREDVRAPRLTRPVWIYRISQAGADLVAEQEDLPRRVIPRPLDSAAQNADAAIYVPPAAALALRELRRAIEARIESPHLPGEPGWRTLQDLRAQILGEDPPHTDWEPRRGREPWERDGGVMESELLPGEPWMGDHDRRDQVIREEREAGWDMLFGEAPLAPGPCVLWPDELAWLVRAGLVQQWTVHEPGRRGVPLYRATAQGGRVLPLEWQAPR